MKTYKQFLAFVIILWGTNGLSATKKKAVDPCPGANKKQAFMVNMADGFDIVSVLEKCILKSGLSRAGLMGIGRVEDITLGRPKVMPDGSISGYEKEKFPGVFAIANMTGDYSKSRGATSHDRLHVHGTFFPPESFSQLIAGHWFEGKAWGERTNFTVIPAN